VSAILNVQWFSQQPLIILEYIIRAVICTEVSYAIEVVTQA